MNMIWLLSKNYQLLDNRYNRFCLLDMEYNWLFIIKFLSARGSNIFWNLTEWLTDWLIDRQTDWVTNQLIEWFTNWLSDLPTNWLPTRIWCLTTTERRGFFVWQTIAKNSSSLHFVRDIFREKSWIIHWLIILLNNHIMFISLYVKLSSRILKIVLENLVEVHHCLYSFRSKER